MTPELVEDKGETVAEKVVAEKVVVREEGKGVDEKAPEDADADAEAEGEGKGKIPDSKTPTEMQLEELETFLSTLDFDSDTDSETSGDILPPSVGAEFGNDGIIPGKGKVEEGKGVDEKAPEAEAEGKGKGKISYSKMPAQKKLEELEALLSTLDSDSDTDLETLDDNFCPSVGVELGNGGVILVLFETPSGFAIFSYDGFPLRLPRAIDNVWADFMTGSLADKCAWLDDFQIFEDKTTAIHHSTGVNERLAMMIKTNIVPGQKLAVGKREYKEIIEHELKIECLFDEIVMELMWGLKNCMRHLVPKEDRRHMSKGMKIVLDRYKLEVEPEMMTGVVYNCDLWEDKYSEPLRAAGKHLKEISNINTNDWDLFKLAVALKIICFPEEQLPGDPLEIFSKTEYSKLLKDAHKYGDKLSKPHCKFRFEELLNAGLLRKKVLGGLAHCVNEARKAYEAGQGLMGSS